MPFMNFGIWDLFFNLFLLAFWIHFWSPAARATLGNPYLAAMRRMTDAVVRFLRPAFLVLPDRAIAGLAIVILLLLRAFSAPRTDSGWILQLGFEWRQPLETAMGSYLVFTVLSFAIFLFQIWGLTLIFLRTESFYEQGSISSALQAVARPFVNLPYVWRPAVLLGFGMLIAAALIRLGFPTAMTPSAYLEANALWLHSGDWSGALVVRALISALAGWVGLLGILVQLMLILIIASWVGMLTQSPALSLMCRDGINMLLGPLRRYPLRIGMFDLSPIVFIFAIGFVRAFLMNALFQSYIRAAGAGG